ncbi:MAG: response regulator [Oligoflexia bacterium]|nr:response regulator [Oligoflexia bacterium]
MTATRLQTKHHTASCNHLLLIEDERDIRESVREILEFEGFQVLEAANGREGLEILKKVPNPCLILLDLMMPVMDGWQFAQALSNDTNSQAVPVILVTAFAEKANTIPCAGVLKKPYDIDHLLSHVKRHCRGEGADQ